MSDKKSGSAEATQDEKRFPAVASVRVRRKVVELG